MKPWYTSKTLWFNILAALVFVANYFGYADFVPDPVILAVVSALVNLVLRFLTKQALSK